MKLLLQRFVMVICLLSTILTISFATQYYVSTTGSDSNPGTIAQPFLTLAKAVGIVAAGDTIYVRGGSYSYTGSSTAITLPAISGTSAALHCNLIGYNGERVLLDFSAMTGTSADGLKINGSYWYIKGFDCKGAPHNGLKISGGSYNTIEFCSSFSNRNTGVQLSSGASYNQFINCDSYFNYDSTGVIATAGGNADGFAPKLDVGTGNYFYGCRSWQNSDDGWDGYLRPSDNVMTTIENCWSFMNGFLKDGITTYPSMNGNGIKMGGSDAVPHILRHNMIVKNCLTFLNKAKGFDQNNSVGSLTLLNCTAYNNGIGTSGGAYNFSTPLALASGKVLTVENCISYVYTKSPGYTFGTQTSPVFATNSWLAPLSGASSADFISIDTTGVRGPRKPDGSLPDITFMHLAPGSQFIAAGTNVGLPYNSVAPDLGCFAYSGTTSITESNRGVQITGFRLSQNYPNPFNPTTKITYQITKSGMVTLKVYDLLGREVMTLVNENKSPGTYTSVWNAVTMSSGMYFSRLESNGERQIRKMILMK